nr:MAG TPA: hypothetical protein [Caudoviricetes sp.]
MTQDDRKTAMYNQGRANAQSLQTKAPKMTGTELYAADRDIPGFTAAVANSNMLKRAAGFICLSPAGRVVRLIQPYDSTIYTQAPEELPAQWGFVWSTDPAKALPFVAISTSPCNKGDCCTEDGVIYRSTIANNVWSPSAYPKGWEAVTE